MTDIPRTASAPAIMKAIDAARSFRDALILRRRRVRQFLTRQTPRPEPLDAESEIRMLDCAIEEAGRRYDTAWAEQDQS